jgi:nucleoside-diphosphate-sugar epimerase
MVKEKILITGGAGYVGSVLTGHLLKEGYQVTCLDDLRYGQRSLLTYVHDKDFNFVFGDARDEKLLAKEISKVDAIVPLAAIVGMPACNRNPYDAASINRDAVMLVNKLRSPSQRLAFPNTNSGYGAQSGEFYCTEETPLEPISLYGKTKVEAEKHLLESDKPAIVLRLATVFGFSPRMRMDLLVNDFVHQAMTTGCIGLFEKDFVRNYIHIRDIARVFQHCIENFDSMRNGENQVYNVGLDDANLSKGKLALKIKEHLPKTELFEIGGKDPDKRNYIISNKKIADAGFKPIFSLDDGIEELIKGYEIMQKTDPNRNA